MEYLTQSNRHLAGDQVFDQITAEGKHVVVLGGGDTGADCIGTAHRQGALSVTNLAIGRQPGEARPEHQPWPMHPTVFEVQSAHEEGGVRQYLASTVEFLANEVGEVRAIRVAETEYLDGRRVPKAGSEREIPLISCCWRSASRVPRRASSTSNCSSRSVTAATSHARPTTRPPNRACS
jgi:glutamate synthase (NADPH/NADH) small chain